MMTQAKSDTEILERGNIYSCYTPKVERDEVNGFDDVQQFYFVLAPHGKQSYRLIAIGKKRLPEVKGNGNNQ